MCIRDRYNRGLRLGSDGDRKGVVQYETVNGSKTTLELPGLLSKLYIDWYTLYVFNSLRKNNNAG